MQGFPSEFAGFRPFAERESVHGLPNDLNEEVSSLFPKLPKMSELLSSLQQVYDRLLDTNREEESLDEHVESDEQSWLKKLEQKKLVAAGILAVVLLLSGCSAAYLLSDSSNLADSSQKIFFQVRPGADVRSIARAMEEKGIIGNRYKFFWYAKWKGVENDFKTGNYAFHGNMDMDEVMEKLIAGDTTVMRFTIPEGFGVKEIAERLSEEGLVNEREFLKKAENFAPYSYMKKQPNVRYAAEGFLFPDTYTVDTDIDTDAILRMMAGNLDNRLTAELRDRAEEQNLSIYELITLASLVEKEARYDEDRPIIAQVFFKRLEIGMPLQTDASLQYLMDAPKEDVLIEDTKIDSPYNTYQHMGLPPGPIANPGMAAIEAVLYPAHTDYLYFVADREGHNHYSHSYDRHLDLVDEVR